MEPVPLTEIVIYEPQSIDSQQSQTKSRYKNKINSHLHSFFNELGLNLKKTDLLTQIFFFCI